MSTDRKRMKKRISGVVLIAVVTAALSLVLLRAALALTMFRGLSGSLQQYGWTADTTGSIMEDGESLTYEAGYLFFKIGRVKLEVLGKTTYEGFPAYHVRAAIDSYSGIPFVNLHAVFNCYAKAQDLMCLFEDNIQRDGKDSTYTSYNFDFRKKVIVWRRFKNGTEIDSALVPLDKGYTDGVSFFYYIRNVAREANGIETTMSVPIIVDTTRSSVRLTINEKKDECKVEAFKYPLQAYKMSGHINFTGFFGVTGDFKGWMSADSAEVPLKANVSVILGSVVVSLKEVHRAGWTPPRVKD